MEFLRKKIGMKVEIRLYTTQHYTTLQNTRLQYLLTELLEGTHAGLTARWHRLLTIRPSRLCTMPPVHLCQSAKSCQTPGRAPSEPECGPDTRWMISRPYSQRLKPVPFCEGRISEIGRADFDWLIADANMAKVLDGKYDSQVQGRQEQPQTNNPFLRMLQEEGEL